jgi:hypothetical protein
MKPDKYEQLAQKYPKIFAEGRSDALPTCGDGWYDLLDTLCGTIQHHINWKLKSNEYAVQRGEAEPIEPETLQFVVGQVKEKFGGLRFYGMGGDDFTSGAISMAESMSFKICETCGAPGRPTNDGWITTTCDGCKKA